MSPLILFSLCYQEFLYSGRCLADDAKNYHAWAHRAAIAEAFDAWERELPIIGKMLAEDMRNNSAWNHRFLTLQHLLEGQGCAAIVLPINRLPPDADADASCFGTLFQGGSASYSASMVAMLKTGLGMNSEIPALVKAAPCVCQVRDIGTALPGLHVECECETIYACADGAGCAKSWACLAAVCPSTPALRRMLVGCRESAESLLRSELESLSTIIMKAPHNESAWNYLRGLCCNLTLSALLEPSPIALCLKVSFRYSHRVVCLCYRVLSLLWGKQTCLSLLKCPGCS